MMRRNLFILFFTIIFFEVCSLQVWAYSDSNAKSSKKQLSKEVPTTDENLMSAQEVADTTALDNYVETGFAKRKADLNVSAISETKPAYLYKDVYRFEELVQGKVPGLLVTQQSGAPGSGYSLHLRGVSSMYNASPVILVDGIKTEYIDFLDPLDIETITVLKDASATAIHGVHGGNGLIYITTKNGSKGENKINYRFSTGNQNFAHDVASMDNQQYHDYVREGLISEMAVEFNLAKDDPALLDFVESTFPSSLQDAANTNWLDKTFETAPMSKHHLSMSGGNEVSDYYISANYYDQDGVIGGSRSNYQRLGVRLNGNIQLRDWLKVGNRFAYSHQTREILLDNDELSGVVASALRMDPLTPVYFEDSVPSSYDAVKERLPINENNEYFGVSDHVKGTGIANPLAKIVNSHRNYLEDKLHGKVYATIKFSEGLHFTTSMNTDVNNRYYKNWEPNYYYSSTNNLGYSYVEANMRRDGNLKLENIVSYANTFGDHSISAIAGHSMERLTWRYTYGSKQGLQLFQDNFAHLNSTTESGSGTKFVGGNYADIRLRSFLTGADYSFQNKYLVSVSLRNDAPSDTTEYEDSYNSYSLGLGWIISNESFWTVSAIDLLKVRASMGQAANYYDQNPFYATPVSKLNVGLDVRAMNNKLSFSVDYFDETTSDMQVYTLIDTIVDWYTLGDVTNSGLEFNLGFGGQSGEFKYGFNANLTALTNEVNNVSELLGGIYGSTAGSYYVTGISNGNPLYHFMGFETNGIYQTNAEAQAYMNSAGEEIQPIAGDVRFVDANGDGILDEGDITSIGNPYPGMFYGLSANLAFKGIDVSATVQGAADFDVYNAVNGSNVGWSNRPTSFYDDRWTAQNGSNEWFRAVANDNNNNTRPSAYFIEDGSYTKLRNVTIGYTIPENAVNKIRLKNLRFYVSMNNILTISGYSGLDPEIAGYGIGSYGIDKGMFPKASSVLFGLNVAL